MIMLNEMTATAMPMTAHRSVWRAVEICDASPLR